MDEPVITTVPDTSSASVAIADVDSFEAHESLRKEKLNGSAPAKEPEEKTEKPPAPKGETAVASEATEPKVQEKEPGQGKPKKAADRAKELIAQGRTDLAYEILEGESKKAHADRITQLEEELRQARTRKPDPEPAKQEQKTAPAAQTSDDPEPTLQAFLAKYAADHPDALYAEGQEAFFKEVRAWDKREAKRENEKAQAETTKTATVQRATSAFDAAKKKYADLETVIAADVATGSGLIYTPAMQQVFFEDPEVGFEVAYYLGKNPAEYKRIFALSGTRQIVEMGKIEDKLQKPPDDKKPAPVSKAPEPIRNVSGAASSDNDSLAEADTQEEFERRHKKRFGRAS